MRDLVGDNYDPDPIVAYEAEQVRRREEEISYNCPSCRYDCAPEFKVKATCFQTMHCNLWEPKSGMCPKCGSEKEPHAELKILGENDETVVWVCQDCGNEEE